MTGIVAKFARIRFVFTAAALAFAAAWGGAQRAEAQGLTYVEGVDQLGGALQNIFRADGGDINTALDPNQLANGSVPGNNLWNYRDEGVPDPSGTFATIYESIQEDSPELRQQISGLTANTMYDVYVAYWSDASNWGVRAGFTSNANANTLFNVTGANFGTAGTLAGSGAWTSPPADNPEDTVDNPSPFINITDLGGTAAPATQTMYLGFVGATTSNASGQINVFIDDQANTVDANLRSWLDGLAYVPAGTAVFVTATLNRDTGNLVINNPTGTTFNIASYSLASAGGAMIAGQWDSIAVGGNATIAETHPWATTSTTAALLSEAETPPNNGAQLVATTGAFNVGNVWLRTPIQDVQITLTLTNGSSITVAPTYTGTAIANGDFNADGMINIADFTILKANMHSNTSALTNAQAFQLGDTSQDRAINGTDFVAFRAIYDQANGAGSFQAMLNSIPEPSAGILAALGLGLLRAPRCRRATIRASAQPLAAAKRGRIRRSLFALGAVVVCLSSAAASAQTVLPVTGWFAFRNADGTAVPITNPATNSPTVGDGTPLNADNTTIWAAFQPRTFANGQEVVLRGRVTLDIGPAVTGDAFRFGLFDGGPFTDPYTPAVEPLVGNVPASRTTTQPNGWLGFLFSARSGTDGGLLTARNPAASGDFQFLSTAGNPPGWNAYPLAGLGLPPDTWDDDNNPATPPINKTQTPTHRAIALNIGSGTGNFNDDTYDFNMTIGRFGFENTMSATLTSRTFAGDLDVDQDVDGNDFLLLQRQATVTAAGMTTFRNNFGTNTPDFRSSASATASPAQDTNPSFITNEIDRIGFLLSGGMDTSSAVFSNIELEIRQIQSLILDVNTNTGAVSVRNASGVPFDVVYYEITSVNGNLSTGGWVSLDEGEGGDPDGVGWDELGTATANILSEGNLTGSRLVNNGQSFSLGNAFNTATTIGNRDTDFRFATADGTIRRGVVNYNTTSSAGAVPEPGSLALTALALLAVGGARRKKN